MDSNTLIDRFAISIKECCQRCSSRLQLWSFKNVVNYRRYTSATDTNHTDTTTAFRCCYRCDRIVVHIVTTFYLTPITWRVM